MRLNAVTVPYFGSTTGSPSTINDDGGLRNSNGRSGTVVPSSFACAA